MIVTRRTFLAAIPLSLAASRASAFQPSKVGQVVAEAAADFLRRTPQAVGLSIGAILGGDVHEASFGSLSPGGRDRPTATTIFPLASITKTFTGTLLAQAATEGRLKLDDDIRSYLDGNYPNLAYEGQPIRLWHLVNHVSGLPFNLPDLTENRPPFPEASAAVKRRLAAYTRSDFYADLHAVTLARIPGTDFSYSNAAATLLSYILERVYAKPFEALIASRITVPLGMRDTVIAVDSSQAARMARGYDERGSQQPPVDDRTLGAAAIKSTVADMLRYLKWQIAERNAALSLSHRPHPISGKFAVGLNWQMMIDGPRRRIWQDGTAPGYCAMCAFLPETRTGLIAFSNELDRDSMRTFETMTERILTGLDPSSTKLF